MSLFCEIPNSTTEYVELVSFQAGVHFDFTDNRQVSDCFALNASLDQGDQVLSFF